MTTRLWLVAVLSLITFTAAYSGQQRGQPSTTAAASTPLTAQSPFTVAVNMTTIETAPAFLAETRPAGASFTIVSGGIRNLANGTAHAATNAETQMLLVTPSSPNIRLLLTVAEGLYRVIGRKSAGITTLASLRGKRITTPRNTSAHYHLVKMLRTAGVAESEVTLVTAGATEMAAAIARRDADAISMWEPEAQNALEALGSDATVFQDNTVYRELFSLYTTTEVLNDARRRRELVAFVRALLAAGTTVRATPKDVMPLVARKIQQSDATVSRSWPFHAFPVALLPDTLDVMADEEPWIAASQQRQPRTRQQLATFIDPSILREAQAPAR